MGNDLFEIVFSGRISEGADPRAVKASLGRLVKVDGERLDRLFSGSPVVIRRNVDRATAQKYRVALRKAGAECEIRSTSSGVPRAPGPGAARTPAAREQTTRSERGAESQSAAANIQGSFEVAAFADHDLEDAWAHRRRLRRWGLIGGACVGAGFGALLQSQEEAGAPMSSNIGVFLFSFGVMGAGVGFVLVALGRMLNSGQRMLARELRGAHRSADLEPSRHVREDISAGRLIGRFLVPGLGLAVVLLIGTVFVHAHKDMGMKARVAYALAETGRLNNALVEFLLKHGRLPAGSAELGMGERQDYPDGGYFYLTQWGSVVIRFTVLPELAVGGIHVTPTLVGEGRRINWACRSVGGFPTRYLPVDCRK